MMRFFVRNLFAKLCLLGLLALPLALYGLNESKKLAEAGIADDKAVPPAPGGEAELKQAQDESAKLASMPSDLRKELLFPGGRPTNDAPEPYLVLSKAVRNRAAILAAHRQFLLQYGAKDLKDIVARFDPLFAASLGKDLTTRYTKLLTDKRDQLIAQGRLRELRVQLEKVEPKALPDLAKEINGAIEDYTNRWKEISEVTDLRKKLEAVQLTVARDAADAECIKAEAAWKRTLQLPSAETIKTFQPQVDALLVRLRAVEIEATTQKDTERKRWVADKLAIWTHRRDFLPDAATLLESMNKALADARVEDFFARCTKLVIDHPAIEEARKLARGIAEDFCTQYLLKQPMDPVKYDDVVKVTAVDDKTIQEFPRKQVRVYFKKTKGADGAVVEERRFLKDGDPIKNDGYTEFHAALDKDKIDYVTVFDEKLQDPIDSKFIQRPISSLKPTDKSIAVRFYCDEYPKIDRWNAETVSAFVRKCEPHKQYLGDIWNRLEKMNKAMKDAKELFPAKS